MTMDLDEERVNFSLDENNSCDQLTNGNSINATDIVITPFARTFSRKRLENHGKAVKIKRYPFC